jgi:DNA-binding transcriptional regulator YdaS (Cro superfamily)
MDNVLREAIAVAGGTAALAEHIGIQAPSIYSWTRVPPNRVLAVEAVTGISRHRLRPDLYPPDAEYPAVMPPAATVKTPPDKLARAAQRLFASGLREARLQYGNASGQGEITQREFARMLGIHGERPEERYRLYEAAKREPPLWILASLRRVTGYSLDDLVAQLPAGRRLLRDVSAQHQAAE